MAFPLAVWLMMKAGLPTNAAIGIALVVLLALDWTFDFSAVMSLMTPVILIGGMTWACSPRPRPPSRPCSGRSSWVWSATAR